MNSKLRFDTENFSTFGTKKLAIAASVASQLPGRDFGPADAFRHLVLSAELYRRFPDIYAKELLEKHENLNNPPITFNQDTYMNEVGRLIGQHVEKQGGKFRHIRSIVEKYMQANLAHIEINDVNNWVMGGGDRGNNTEFLINPNLRSVSIDGLILPGIALRHPHYWDRNPKRDIQQNGESSRLSNQEANWPDQEGKWINRFNHKGAELYLNYDPAKSKTLPVQTQQPHPFGERQKSKPRPDDSPEKKESNATKTKLGNSVIYKPKPLPDRSLSPIYSMSPQDSLQNRQSNNTSKNNHLRRVQLAQPRQQKIAVKDSGFYRTIPIEELDQPTPEMIAKNVFIPDESGKTNITKEAKILKKNRKLSLKLIELAGRRREFEALFPVDSLA